MTARPQPMTREQARRVLGFRLAYGWDLSRVIEPGPDGPVWRIVVGGRATELVIDSRGECACLPSVEPRSA